MHNAAKSIEIVASSSREYCSIMFVERNVFVEKDLLGAYSKKHFHCHSKQHTHAAGGRLVQTSLSRL